MPLTIPAPIFKDTTFNKYIQHTHTELTLQLPDEFSTSISDVLLDEWLNDIFIDNKADKHDRPELTIMVGEKIYKLPYEKIRADKESHLALNAIFQPHDFFSLELPDTCVPEDFDWIVAYYNNILPNNFSLQQILQILPLVEFLKIDGLHKTLFNMGAKKILSEPEEVKRLKKFYNILER